MKKNFLLICAVLIYSQIFGQLTSGVEYKAYRVLMDSTWNSPVEKKVNKIISKYKPLMESSMMDVIGKTDVEMRSGRPESLLSNFTTDAMLNFARKKSDCDFSVTNFGGIRAAMPAGDVRRYDIFSIFPFENYLVIVELPGSSVRELFNFFAKSGPEAVSGNVRLNIKKGALASEVLIDGIPISDKKNYKIATLDFLLTGGDNLTMLKNSISVNETGVLLRDVIFDQISEIMKKEGKISSKLDGRVVIEK